MKNYYAIFDRDGNMLEFTIRKTSRECWEWFENYKNTAQRLPRLDDKRYGYECKRIKIEL